MSRYEIEMQVGDTTHTLYVRARSADAAVAAARVSASSFHQRWARFVVTGR